MLYGIANYFTSLFIAFYMTQKICVQNLTNCQDKALSFGVGLNVY